MWMDMTTEKAWANHYRKYGSVEGVPESMHKATYQSDGYSGFMVFEEGSSNDDIGIGKAVERRQF